MTNSEETPEVKPRVQINPPVFFGAAGLIVVFVIFAMIAPERAGDALHDSTRG